MERDKMVAIKECYGKQLAEIEARIHRNPEISFQEFETTKLIKDELYKLDMEIIDLGLETGVIARLKGQGNGPTVGLRADIDALKQEEKTNRHDRSLNKGVMHACGHDVHTTGLIGAAMALSDLRPLLKGDVVFIFQPAEEIIEGAQSLIEHGLFKKVPMDMIFGLHVMPMFDVGKIGVKKGAIMSAKDDFMIKVKGLGGHGGIPNKCIDPIIAASSIVNNLQTIVSRNISPFDVAVVSVCSIHGGTVDNLIADEVVLLGSARTMDSSVQKKVIERIFDIASLSAKAHGCTIEFDHYGKTPPLINGERMAELARKAAIATVVEENIFEPESFMISDDFAEFASYLPTFYYFLGSGIPSKNNPSLHNAYFQTADDTAFWGAAILVNSVLVAQE